MKKNSEEVQVIKSAIKFYRAAVKEYAVLGNINEVLQSMIDDLVAYTCDPVPGDWQTLAAKLYNDLSILEKAAQDNGVTNASVLSPLSSAGQIARNLTKLNKSEPTQKLQHYYEAIRNNLCDVLRNISPDPKVRTQKAGVNYSRLIRFDTDSVQYIATTLYNVLHNDTNISLDQIHDLYELLDGIYATFDAYRANDGRSYFDINPRFNTLMEKGLDALSKPHLYQLDDVYQTISNIINTYDRKPI